MNIEDVAEKTPDQVFKLPIREEGVIPEAEMVLAAERLGVPTEVAVLDELRALPTTEVNKEDDF